MFCRSLNKTQTYQWNAIMEELKWWWSLILNLKTINNNKLSSSNHENSRARRRKKHEPWKEKLSSKVMKIFPQHLHYLLPFLPTNQKFQVERMQLFKLLLSPQKPKHWMLLVELQPNPSSQHLFYRPWIFHLLKGWPRVFILAAHISSLLSSTLTTPTYCFPFSLLSTFLYSTFFTASKLGASILDEVDLTCSSPVFPGVWRGKFFC